MEMPAGPGRDKSGEFVERVRRLRRMRLTGVTGLVAAPAAGLALVLLGGMLTPAVASGSTPSGTHVRDLVARPAADPASLAMTSSVSPSPLVVGETAVYTVTVANAGTADAADVVTTLPFDP